MAAADCKPTSESCRSRPLGTTPRRPQLAPELGPFLLGQRKTRRLGRVLQSRIGGAPLVFLGGLFDWRGLLRTELQTSARFGFQLRGLRALKHPPDTPVWKLGNRALLRALQRRPPLQPPAARAYSRADLREARMANSVHSARGASGVRLLGEGEARQVGRCSRH
jgi:hypothetical protein